MQMPSVPNIITISPFKRRTVPAHISVVGALCGPSSRQRGALECGVQGVPRTSAMALEVLAAEIIVAAAHKASASVFMVVVLSLNWIDD